MIDYQYLLINFPKSTHFGPNATVKGFTITSRNNLGNAVTDPWMFL